MAKQITDDEDRLKRQARRRLIGAVALTTAIVVVLPMVLDSEPKPVGQDIELRIPNKDKVAAFAPKIDLPLASAPVAALPVSSVAAVSASVIVSQPVSQVAAVPAVAPVAVPVAAVAPPDIKPAPSPAKTAAIVPEHKPDQAKHDAKPEHAKHDAKPSQAKLDAKPAGVAHTEQGQPAPRSGFIVQIGAFANADTAHSWQKNLVQQGFKAYTEKVGDKTRVRIGPYSTRDAANKARHKLEAKGLHSNIVALD
jgi:DedD protein